MLTEKEYFGAVLLMTPISWVYFMTTRANDVDRSFAQTMIVLPVIVAGIALIVQNSLALAFSLAGVVVNNAIVLVDYVNLLRERRAQEGRSHGFENMASISTLKVEKGVMGVLARSELIVVTCPVFPFLSTKVAVKEALKGDR